MLNIVVLTGNLGSDPEMHYTADGNPIATLNLAFRSGKDKTGWIKVTAFGKLAEIAEQYLRKGSKITVAGSIDQEKWQSSDGSPRTGFKLIANSIDFIKVDSTEDDFPGG